MKKKLSLKPSQIEQEDFTVLAKKLKKTEVVKRPIEKVEIETVELIHHEFEPEPQLPKEENSTAPTFLGDPLPDVPEVKDDLDGDAVKKKKKKLIKTIVKKHPESKEEKKEDIKVRKGFQEPVEEIPSIKDLKPVVKEEESAPARPSDEPEAAVFSEVKLKKAKVVKRPINEPELEKVELVHHEFENSPKDIAPEKKTSALIDSAGSLIDNENEEKKKKKKKLVKTKPKETEVAETRSPSPSESLSEKEKYVDEDVSEQVVEDSGDSKVKKIKRTTKKSKQEEKRIEHSVKYPERPSSESELPITIDEEPKTSESTVKDNTEELSKVPMTEEEEAPESIEDAEQKPVDKEGVTMTNEEPVAEKEDASEPIEDVKKSLKPVVKKPKLKKEEVKEDNNIFSKVKLKKAEVVKRPIEKADIETVELVSHKFEIQPQPEAKEMKTSVKMTSTGELRDDDKKKVKKIKKVVKKKVVSEPSPSETDSVREPSPTPSEVSTVTDRDHSKAVTPEAETLPAEVESEETKYKPETKLPADEEKEQTPDGEPEVKTETASEPIEEIKKTLKPVVKKPKVKKEEVKEENNLFTKVKLKKSEVVKRPIEKTDIETVELVSHKFENQPQSEAKEMKTSVKITSTGELKDDDQKKVKKIKKVVKKKVVSEPSPSETDSVRESSPAPSEVSIATDKDLSTAQNSESETPSGIKSEEVKPTTKKPAIKKKPAPKEPEPKPEMPKLKKTAPRKPREPSPEKEMVKLKHHEFEVTPLDIPAEQPTGAIIRSKEPKDATPEETTKSKKPKKEKPKKKEIKINPLVAEDGEDDQPVEEVERKPRDPIAVPAAAVQKKHSDIEKES